MWRTTYLKIGCSIEIVLPEIHFCTVVWKSLVNQIIIPIKLSVHNRTHSNLHVSRLRLKLLAK